MLHVKETARGPYPAFADRRDAGNRLARYLQREGADPDVVVAVPSGGVAVALPVARELGAAFDMVLVRKLPLPAAPEAGFGAIFAGGEKVINPEIVAAWGLDSDDVERVIRRVQDGLRCREQVFMGDREHVHLEGRSALLVDDGLASGSTMKVAIGGARRRGAARIAVGVPDAPERTLEQIEPLVDDLYCLVAQRGGAFAVASYYARWHDLSDEEVLELLRHREGEGEGRDAARR
jgi:putative phosphoribosyl transferase